MINYNINHIFTPEFLQQMQMISQTQQVNYESQPAELVKVLHALDDFYKAYKNVAPEYKMQAQQACFFKVLSEIKNGAFSYEEVQR